MTRTADEASYHDLLCYTLAHPDPVFIHQYAVDAYAAQHVMPGVRPISYSFPLLGLYLCVEKRATGRHIQRLHVHIGALRNVEWPTVIFPENRGTVTACDVLAAAPGAPRDEMVLTWCAAVWSAWSESQSAIRKFTDRYQG
jgi:hypothetical protein